MRRILIASAAFASLANSLFAQTATGTIRIKTDATQVQALIDGKDAGVTPVTMAGIAPGFHQFVLSKPGFNDYSDSVLVESGKTASLFILMKKRDTPLPSLPASFRAIHEHGMGHCVGTLVVHHDSITYKADKGPDSYSIPIRAIKTVQRGSGANWGSLIVSAAGAAVTGAATGIATTTVQSAEAGVGSTVPLRIDIQGKGFSFLGYANGDDPAVVPTKDMPIDGVAKNNQALFDIVYRLYLDDLKAR